MTTPRDSILSIHPSWWPAFFWIFIVQLIWETIMILLDAGPALSDMSLFSKVLPEFKQGLSMLRAKPDQPSSP